MSDPIEEIKASFFIECEELHEALTDAIDALSSGTRDIEIINIAFRAVHSIKGGSGAFGLNDLVNFTHQFENTLDACRSNELEITEPLINLFIRASDHLSDLISAAQEHKTCNIASSAELIKELNDWVPAETPKKTKGPKEFNSRAEGEEACSSKSKASGQSQTIVRFQPEPELYNSGNEPLILLRNLAELGPCEIKVELSPTETLKSDENWGSRLSWVIQYENEIDTGVISDIFEFVDGLCSLTINTDEAVPGSIEEYKSTTDHPSFLSKKQVSQTVRVDLERIDRLVNLVGELVINQSMLSQSINQEDQTPNSDLTNGLDEFLQLTRDIQESVMMIRAQPVKSLFQRMARIVREASQSVDKSAVLTVTGEATEIDKTAIERLAEPLTHMIRNAVDHGLETDEDRLASGKEERAEIHLSAAHKSGRVIIELSDNGRGIDRERIRSIAISKGLISKQDVLSENEIDQLLFLPGFSTATQVSNLSGRGVGMDVVKTEITALGGRISIQSEFGKGTKITISLPLTLAVLDGMVVTAAGETLILPLNAVVESISLKSCEMRQVANGLHVLPVRNVFVPVLDLGYELGYRSDKTLRDGSIALLLAPEDNCLIAVIVDTIEDQRQVVIKGLQDSYGHVPGVAAATILGDGKIALILDPTDLIKSSSEDLPDLRKAS